MRILHSPLQTSYLKENTLIVHLTNFILRSLVGPALILTYTFAHCKPITKCLRYQLVLLSPLAGTEYPSGSPRGVLKNAVCEVCCKSFHSPAHLRMHMRVHTGERPFKCDVCGKGFTQKGHLKSHMLVHIDRASLP